MCIGIPMQVETVDGVFAQVCGRGQSTRVNTMLVGTVKVGDWVLVHLNNAREKLDSVRVQEINATLDMLDAALQNTDTLFTDTLSRASEATQTPDTLAASNSFDAFALPSRMDPQLLQQWTGHKPQKN